jgi:hypothetical protein
MPTAHITQHALERCKERCGWKRDAAQRMADKALELGIRHADTKGAIKRYFDHLYMVEKNANNLRIYGRHVFVFYHERLITVLHLDHQYIRTVEKLQQERAAAKPRSEPRTTSANP